ncbi:MAG: PAS domain S-box protein [Bacteroidales bacterium]|jgi:PAS domain S-box-containing protein|nr:PAS domain S-box protein [Bacteroidales bacterium]
MITIVAIIIAIGLQIIAFISAIWLTRYAKNRIAWTLIAIAMIFMALRRAFELFELFNYGSVADYSYANHWLGFIVSTILAFSVIGIARILYNASKAEEAKEESEKRFSTLFHNSSDEIFLADLNGNFLEVNQVACESLGYSPEEFRKMNFKDIKSSKYVDKVKENIERVLVRGKLIYESEHVSKQGKVLSLEMKSRLINYQGRKAILSIARDITERKQLEREILRAVINAEERERERIASEIHDDLGPLMSTIKLYVSELESDDLQQLEREEFLLKVNEILDEAITSTRTIANNLTPRVIIDFGLVKALDSFSKKLNLSQKVNIIYEASVSERFDQTIELVLYRVVTELLNNSMKHADASKIEVHLEKFDNILQLTYMDDGVGFDLDEVLQNESSGMGLKNIISRLQSINGSYRIHSRKDSGTLVVVEIKLPGQNPN